MRREVELPTRDTVARALETFLNNTAGYCSWPGTITRVISELYDGTMSFGEAKLTTKDKCMEFPPMTAAPPPTPGNPKRKPPRGRGGGKRVRRESVAVSRPKYGQTGGFGASIVDNLEMPEEFKALTKELCDASLARTTWRCYTTGERAAARCEEDTNYDLTIPWDVSKCALFVAWAHKKNLAASTILQYFSGIKALHKKWGLSTEAWNSHVTKAMIRGRSNTQAPRKQKKEVSPGLMKILREKIKRSTKMEREDKVTLWAVMSLLYYGSLRGGEVLGAKEDTFDPTTTLMNADVKIEQVATEPGKSTWMVAVRVRNPKELKGQQEVTVECFATGGENCPVRAVRGVTNLKRGGNRPFASRKDGSLMTKKWLNRTLRDLLQGIVDYDVATISSHSFRAGLATAMARAGYSDEEIKRQGRWRSDAFMKYIKLGRATRLEQQQALASNMERIAKLQISEMGARA